MKKNYLNNVPFDSGELTVVISNTAERVMRHSCELAGAIKSTGRGTLIINCGMSRQRFRSYALAKLDPLAPPCHGKYLDTKKFLNVKEYGDLLVSHCLCGDLIGEREWLNELIKMHDIKVLIIAGWEWTSSTWRRRERLLYYLRELMDQLGIAIVVYSQATTKPIAGKYDRGGIGKLGMLAYAVIADDLANALEEIAPKDLPTNFSENDWEEAGRSALLLASKINELQGEKSNVRRLESGVGEMHVVISNGGEAGERNLQ